MYKHNSQRWRRAALGLIATLGAAASLWYALHTQAQRQTQDPPDSGFTCFTLCETAGGRSGL